MPARPSALFFAPETPYPLAGGGALRTASLLDYLAARYDVDVIVFRQPGAPDPCRACPARLVRRINVHRPTGQPAQLLPPARCAMRDASCAACPR